GGRGSRQGCGALDIGSVHGGQRAPQRTVGAVEPRRHDVARRRLRPDRRQCPLDQHRVEVEEGGHDDGGVDRSHRRRSRGEVPVSALDAEGGVRGGCLGREVHDAVVRLERAPHLPGRHGVHPTTVGRACRACRKLERVLICGAVATYDLVIRNGVVVDGTGLPRRRADVAVQDGRIAEIGFVDGSGTRELDVDGRVVAPGIVDPHTHYDPQLTFEPYATSSCFHGVTPVVAGNCGFSVAPLRPGDAGWLIQLFARVEGMDASALEGIPFDGFETFPEYLRSLDGRIGVNAAFYVGHCAVRRYVMGDACQEREATDDEISAMEAIVADAMTHGAAGFSSTHSPTHFDSADRPVPSRLSSTGELERLVAAAGRAAHGGSIAYLPLSAVGGITPDDEQLLTRLSLEARMPVIIQGLGARSKVDAPTAGWDNAKRFVDEATAHGAAVYSLAMSKPFNRTFDLAA